MPKFILTKRNKLIPKSMENMAYFTAVTFSVIFQWEYENISPSATNIYLKTGSFTTSCAKGSQLPLN